MQALFVEVLGDDALNDPPDAVPRDPQQSGDRLLGHLLGKPRHDVLEVAGVVGVRSGPRHRLQVHAAVAAAQAPQLALDYTAAGAEIQVPPALDAPVVDLKLRAGLPAARAHPSPAPELDGHDHPLTPEADVDDRRPGQAQQPLECRGGTHLVPPRKSLTF